MTAYPHELYRKGDEDIPSSILDPNGDVALGMCKLCGKGEQQLIDDPVCQGSKRYAEHLSFADISKVNLLRSEDPKGFGHKLESWTLSQWSNATLVELGEAGGAAKKIERLEAGIAGNFRKAAQKAAIKGKSEQEIKEMLLAHLEEELADTFLYLDLYAQRAGVNLAKAVVKKFNQTSEEIGAPQRLPEPEDPADAVDNLIEEVVSSENTFSMVSRSAPKKQEVLPVCRECGSNDIETSGPDHIPFYCRNCSSQAVKLRDQQKEQKDISNEILTAMTKLQALVDSTGRFNGIATRHVPMLESAIQSLRNAL